MNNTTIPAHWRVRRSTPFFTRGNVPPTLLSHHNTAAGVFGQICVIEGTVTYLGFPDEEAETPEIRTEISAGQFTITPPQYWHRVELSDDARFNIHFWADPESTTETLFSGKK